MYLRNFENKSEIETVADKYGYNNIDYIIVDIGNAEMPELLDAKNRYGNIMASLRYHPEPPFSAPLRQQFPPCRRQIALQQLLNSGLMALPQQAKPDNTQADQREDKRKNQTVPE